jgi:hypothetical protein
MFGTFGRPGSRWGRPLAAGVLVMTFFTVAPSAYAAASELPASSVSAVSGSVPTFDTPRSTADGFTVNVTNYSTDYAWSATTDAGQVSTGPATYRNLPIIVTGLQPGQRATVTVSADMPGLDSSRAIVTGTALPSSAGQSTRARSASRVMFIGSSSRVNAAAKAQLRKLLSGIPAGATTTRLAISVTVPQDASAAQALLARQRALSITNYLTSKGLSLAPVVAHPASKQPGVATVTVTYLH